MMEKKRKARLVGYLVKRLREKYESKQIGKTVVQKMIYLLGLESDISFDYSMYHYGPFSKSAASALDLAKKYDLVEMEWRPKKGYFIDPTDKVSEKKLDDETSEALDEVVARFGGYSAVELSMIATGFYVKDNFEYGSDEELVDTVSSLKSEHEKDWIEDLLLKEGVIGEET